MYIPSSNCPVCHKPKAANAQGKVADHSECSKELQRKFMALNKVKNDKRKETPCWNCGNPKHHCICDTL